LKSYSHHLHIRKKGIHTRRKGTTHIQTRESRRSILERSQNEVLGLMKKCIHRGLKGGKLIFRWKKKVPRKKLVGEDKI
jgi:hypothetical protein